MNGKEIYCEICGMTYIHDRAAFKDKEGDIHLLPVLCCKCGMRLNKRLIKYLRDYNERKIKKPE